MNQENEQKSVRIDKWLWATRFYKTRTMAASACDGGKIKRTGQSLKPSTKIKVGDQLTIPAHEANYQKSIKVLALLDKRVSASEASKAYEDHTPEQKVTEAREIAREQRLLKKDGIQGRLTKKNRRDWEKATGGFFE